MYIRTSDAKEHCYKLKSCVQNFTKQRNIFKLSKGKVVIVLKGSFYIIQFYYNIMGLVLFIH